MNLKATSAGIENCSGTRDAAKTENLHNVDFQKLGEIIIDKNYNYKNTSYSRESLCFVVS